jgi:hypothetical protein
VSQFRDIDRGAKALLQRMAKVGSGGRVSVGLLAREASTPKRQRDGKPGKISLLEVANLHEFGSSDGRIPARSFIRAWYDEKREDGQKVIRILANRVLSGTLSWEQMWHQLGLFAVGSIQKRMATPPGIKPELKQATIDAKGSSMPLIDTGQLRQSISYVVE